MKKLENNIPIRIAMLMDDTTSSRFLEILKENSEVELLQTLQTPKDVLTFLGNGLANALLIDIFKVGIEKSIELIETVRKEHSHVPITLIGTSYELNNLPNNVPDNWKKRFSHYYKMPHDIDRGLLKVGLDDLVLRIEDYLQDSRAFEDLRQVRNVLIKEFESENQALVKEISNKLENAEKTLERKQTSTGLPYLIHGFDGEDIKQLVNDTLAKASLALETTTKVNKWILICGLLLVIASFAVAGFTQRWEIMTFGGFGIAGIIASLITNPIKTIGANAKQIIQLQIAYVGFLKQLSLLDAESETNQQISSLEKSKQLNEAIEKILKSLNENLS